MGHGFGKVFLEHQQGGTKGVFAVSQKHDSIVAAATHHSYLRHPSSSLGKTCRRALEGPPGGKCRTSRGI